MNITNYLKRISESVDKSGFTVTDICKKINLSRNSFYQKIKGKNEFTLEELEKISKVTGKPLSYFIEEAETLPVDNPSMVKIPIFGIVPAGNMATFNEKPDWLTIDKYFVKDLNVDDLFCLIAKGECLKDAGLFDGDQVIVSKTAKCKDGDICVVRIDDEITCKKTYFIDNKIILETMNSQDNKKFIIDPKKKDVQIIGKVVKAIKNFA